MPLWDTVAALRGVAGTSSSSSSSSSSNRNTNSSSNSDSSNGTSSKAAQGPPPYVAMAPRGALETIYSVGEGRTVVVAVDGCPGCYNAFDEFLREKQEPEDRIVVVIQGSRSNNPSSFSGPLVLSNTPKAKARELLALNARKAGALEACPETKNGIDPGFSGRLECRVRNRVVVPGQPLTDFADWDRKTRGVLAKLAARAEQFCARFEAVRVLSGSREQLFAEAVMECCTELDANLLVVASHKQKPKKANQGKSFSSVFAMSNTCPVLVLGKEESFNPLRRQAAPGLGQAFSDNHIAPLGRSALAGMSGLSSCDSGVSSDEADLDPGLPHRRTSSLERVFGLVRTPPGAAAEQPSLQDCARRAQDEQLSEKKTTKPSRPPPAQVFELQRDPTEAHEPGDSAPESPSSSLQKSSCDAGMALNDSLGACLGELSNDVAASGGHGRPPLPGLKPASKTDSLQPGTEVTASPKALGAPSVHQEQDPDSADSPDSAEQVTAGTEGAVSPKPMLRKAPRGGRRSRRGYAAPKASREDPGAKPRLVGSSSAKPRRPTAGAQEQEEASSQPGSGWLLSTAMALENWGTHSAKGEKRAGEKNTLLKGSKSLSARVDRREPAGADLPEHDATPASSEDEGFGVKSQPRSKSFGNQSGAPQEHRSGDGFGRRSKSSNSRSQENKGMPRQRSVGERLRSLFGGH